MELTQGAFRCAFGCRKTHRELILDPTGRGPRLELSQLELVCRDTDAYTFLLQFLQTAQEEVPASSCTEILLKSNSGPDIRILRLPAWCICRWKTSLTLQPGTPSSPGFAIEKLIKNSIFFQLKNLPLRTHRSLFPSLPSAKQTLRSGSWSSAIIMEPQPFRTHSVTFQSRRLGRG